MSAGACCFFLLTSSLSSMKGTRDSGVWAFALPLEASSLSKMKQWRIAVEEKEKRERNNLN